MANGVVFDFFTRVDTKALKKGTKEINHFASGVKKLGVTIGAAFAAQKIIAFGKASLSAFVADDKAAKILAKSLDNLGLSYANPEVKNFISNLETQTGVLDDKLRPAFQKLVTTTADWRKSQDLLKTALDLSAMSGSDVVSVADDLAKAYAGNTKGLLKYGIGLSKTQLQAMSFDDILKQIAKVSSGQAQTAADSYAGSLDKLNVAAANAKETIGKGLVQALTEAGGANGFEGALVGINDFASGVSDAIIGTERLIKIISIFRESKGGFAGAYREVAAFNKANARSDMLSRQQFGGPAAEKYKAAADKAAELKLLKNANALRAIENKALFDKLQASKDQKILDDLKKRNDVERIGLEYALTQATTESARLSIKSQLDIMDGNAKAAAEDLAAQQKMAADKAEAEKRAAERVDTTAKAFELLTTNTDALTKMIDPLGIAFGTLAISTAFLSDTILDKIKALNEGEAHGAASKFIVPGTGGNGILTNVPEALQKIPVGGGSGSENSGGGQGGAGGGGGNQFGVGASIVANPVDEVQDIIDYWAEQTALTLKAMADNIANTPIELQIYGDLNDYGFQYAVQRANQANARAGVSVAGTAST